MSDDNDTLKTRHTLLDFLYWNLVIAVPFITACVAVARHSTAWLIVYILCCILLTAVVLRFYCTHCPHYHGSSKRLTCMFFWAIPKRFKPRPGPLSALDKLVTAVTFVLIILLPTYWLSLQPSLLVIYALSWGVAIATLRRYECRRCVYFDCPSNRAPEGLKGNSEG
jgi:hypothetical protein